MLVEKCSENPGEIRDPMAARRPESGEPGAEGMQPLKTVSRESSRYFDRLSRSPSPHEYAAEVTTTAESVGPQIIGGAGEAL